MFYIKLLKVVPKRIGGHGSNVGTHDGISNLAHHAYKCANRNDKNERYCKSFHEIPFHCFWFISQLRSWRELHRQNEVTALSTNSS